jgi:hypothetical protein
VHRTGDRLGVRRAAALLAALALAGCGGSGEGDGTDPDQSQGTPSEPIEIEVTIDNLQVNASTDRLPVDIGDEVHLTVTSDEDDIVHVHGIERLYPIDAGETTVIEYTIQAGVERGVYTVETHATRVILFEMRVR